ncbi:MAG: alpha/beta fold hydrolase [Pirellulales bacterium]
MKRLSGIAFRSRPLVGAVVLLAVAGFAANGDCFAQQRLIVDLPMRSELPAPPQSALQSAKGGAPDWLDSAIAWTDQLYFRGWRIQRHVKSNEFRLLDEDDAQQAAGTYDECNAALDRIKQEKHLEPMRGKVVILLHGLAAPRWSMKPLAAYLHKHGEYETIIVEYASLRSSIDDAAVGLANIIKNLEGVEEINLVGHSMGNIVIRRYLAGDESPKLGWKPDRRIGRIVMIAPPNHGSITATQLSDTSTFKTVFGASGVQLGKKWKDLEPRLATPSGEFGIIAGGYGNPLGLNPFVPGDDDGRIGVEETRLGGASDSLVIGAVHEFIVFDPRVFEFTDRFLASGYFVSADEKRAIPKESVARRPQDR